jgi:hypothetical protein
MIKEERPPITVLVSTYERKKPERSYLSPEEAAQYVVDQARGAVEPHTQNSLRPEHAEEFRMILATRLSKYADELMPCSHVEPEQGDT